MAARVGWLDPAHEYTRGPVEPAFLEALRRHVPPTWVPVAAGGLHFCEFCPKAGARQVGGAQNAWIPSAHHLFIAPELLIEAREDRVLLGLRWSSSLGQPAREPRPRVIELQPGETAQLIINGRYTSYSGQLYTEATYNVAFGESLAVDVFLQATAPKVFDLRANLF